jgi:D,D-heptose 1,7-bisphosphate phosphatase
MRHAIFLDRDGVINSMVYHPEFGLIDSPANPSEFRLVPGAGDAIRRINELGFLAIVVSNQPGVAKGKFSIELLEATKEKMHHELMQCGARLDAVYYCLHHPEAMLDDYRQFCNCRKPKPGLLTQAADDWQIDLTQSYFIGDGVTDVLAGQRAGTITFLVNGRKCYLCDKLTRQETSPDYMGKDLADAVEGITRLEAGEAAAEEQYRFRCKISCD